MELSENLIFCTLLIIPFSVDMLKNYSLQVFSSGPCWPESCTYYASLHKYVHSRAGLEDGNEKVALITLRMETISIPTLYNHWPDL
jgi:hypothetical protein